MRSPLLLTFRAHRKEPCWFVDHDDGIIQMNDFEALALKGVVAPSLPDRNGHHIVRLQVSIMPDARFVPYCHSPEPEKVLRLFARQSQWQTNQIWQKLASGSDTKLMVVSQRVRFFHRAWIELLRHGHRAMKMLRLVGGGGQLPLSY